MANRSGSPSSANAPLSITDPELSVLATGLRFPEGPIALPNGDVLLVEIERGTLTKVSATGEVTIVATLGGGPNGAAIGPDGACYVCNNGGFNWVEHKGRLFPGEEPENYSGGRIERVDLDTGEVSVLLRHAQGQPLRGPNDLVFDKTGGFWFTDHGKTRLRERDRTGVFYVGPDHSEAREVIFPLEGPNGIGLSPDERELYVAETHTGRLWAYALEGPGQLSTLRQDKPDGGRLITGRQGYFMFDSLALDGNGNVCVATIIDGGISILSPSGAPAGFVAMPDVVTTNICFGGPNLQTAFITLSSTGQLVSMPWPTSGLPLNFLNN